MIKILMINNIKKNLIDNSNIWKTENDGFLISKKTIDFRHSLVTL